MRVSPSFLILIVLLLACALWMVARPDHARFLVFPLVLTGFLIGLCLHEFGHAVIAYVCGDRTVEKKGYLTLDPLHYTDVQYSLLFPLLIMAIGGIGLPGGAVYIDESRLHRRLYGALVSAGGPLATALMLAIVMLVLPMVRTAPILYAALAFLALLELTALLFNLLPCPGFDGWGIVEPLLPEAVRRQTRRMASIGPLIVLIALFAIPSVNTFFWTVVDAASTAIHLDTRTAAIGFGLFQFWR